MSYQPAVNPWDIVNNPPEQVQEYFGAVTINALQVMWIKDPTTGKKNRFPYNEREIDPGTGEPYRARVAIDLSITPLPEAGLKYDITRSMAAEFGDWKDITLPSLRDAGVIEASTLNGKYAHVELCPTSRKYKNQNGEEKTATALKFVRIFETENECRVAYALKYNGNVNVKTEPAPWDEAAAPTKGNGNEKAIALKFAEVLVKAAMAGAGNDIDKAREALAPKLAAQSVVAKYFTVDSPEIINLMAGAL